MKKNDKPKHSKKSLNFIETINDDGILYIRTDCLKIANGDLTKAQEYFEWIIKPLNIAL